MIGVGRVWGTAAGTAPSEITRPISTVEANPASSEAMVRHLKFGSVPDKTSKSTDSWDTAVSDRDGHLTSAVPSPANSTSGRTER